MRLRDEAEMKLIDMTPDQRRESLAQGRTPDTCKILARYLAYDAKNPGFFPVLEQIVADELEKHDFFSVYPIIDDIIRWAKPELRLADPNPGVVYRISNDYKPWYLRRILLVHPEWEDRLELRSLFCCGGWK